ncbi:MAG: ABC transporter substrate-binding protein [Microthrixaceae bacterium]|nr:ABC transporter substrate-binding protein [Microthrixaceae bacterium]
MSDGSRRWTWAIAAVLVLTPACDGGGNSPVLATTTTTELVISDAKALAGLTGTSSLVEVPDDLSERLHRMDETADADAPAAARPYDAAIVAALAAEVARSDSPARIAAQITGVTRGGQRCHRFEGCREFTDLRTDIDYDGPSGEIELLADGQSGDGTFAVMQVTETGALRQISAESADVPPPEENSAFPDPSEGPKADGRLVLGVVLPSSGPQQAAAAAALAGVRVAVEEINHAGGALGRPMELVRGDAGDGSEANLDAAARVVLDAGADVVIGGMEGFSTSRLVDQVVSAGVVLLSPGLPSGVSSVLARSGRFFRLTPPVSVQGAVLAAAVAEDGHTTAALVVSADADGLAMSEAFKTAYEAFDSTVTATITVGQDQPMGPQVGQALALGTDALVVMAGDEAAGAVLAELLAQGQGPTIRPTFVANISPSLLLAAR